MKRIIFTITLLAINLLLFGCPADFDEVLDPEWEPPGEKVDPSKPGDTELIVCCFILLCLVGYFTRKNLPTSWE